MPKKAAEKDHKWLLFFYTVPSKPVSSRMRVWRRLAKAGAIQLKGAVYILPYTEEHYEFFQWLVSEIAFLSGEGTFILAEKVETMSDKEIIALFNKQREADYSNIEKGLDEVERRLQSVKKGTEVQNIKKLSEELNKHLKEFEEIRKIDFFSSRAGNDLKKTMKTLEDEIKDMSGPAVKRQDIVIIPRHTEDYQKKIWITRKKPFVDRMASAWLIRKFVDSNAIFQFIDERKLENVDKNSITFDMKGGEITHIGDLCTFEVLIKSFGIKDKSIKKIAELVHELDMKDDKFSSPEAKGVEEILLGIRKTAKDDNDVLEKGMAVFEMLYASKT